MNLQRPMPTVPHQACVSPSLHPQHDGVTRLLEVAEQTLYKNGETVGHLWPNFHWRALSPFVFCLLKAVDSKPQLNLAPGVF